jgi:hypothetical protein
MVFTAPNGTHITIPYTTARYLIIFDGIFGGSFTPDAVGTWSVAAYFAGDSTYNASSIGPTTFVVTPLPQISITFTTSGISSDASGTVLTIDGTAYGYSTLPQTFTWTQGSTHSVTATTPVGAGSDKQYRWNSWTNPGGLTANGGSSGQPGGTYTVPSSTTTVTANYVTQWQETFQQSGLSNDASGTVLTVGSNTYTYGQLPQTGIWVDDGTTYSYASTLAGSGKTYVLTGVTGGLASPIHSSGTATGNYKIQYQVSFAVSPSGSGTTSPSGTNVLEDPGSLSISASYNSGYRFSSWSATGSITITDPSSANTTATISGTGTITATFTQNAPQTVTLRPSGAGNYQDLSQSPSSGSHYAKVSEITSDGDATYVYTTSTSTTRDTYTFTSTSATGTINSVTIYIVARATSSGTAQTVVRISGSNYYGTSNTLTTSYTVYSTTYTLNPGTDNAWTWANINALDAGVRLARSGSSGNDARCTQIYVVVNYTPP